MSLKGISVNYFCCWGDASGNEVLWTVLFFFFWLELVVLRYCIAIIGKVIVRHSGGVDHHRSPNALFYLAFFFLPFNR